MTRRSGAPPHRLHRDYGSGRRFRIHRRPTARPADAMLGRREMGARDHRLRRGLRRPAAPRPHYRPLVSILESFTPDRDRPAGAAAEALAGGPGHHLHGLRREGRARAHLPVRLRAAHHPRPRSGSASRPASSSASPRSTCSSPTSTRTRSASRTASCPPSSSSRARSTSASCCGVIPPRQDLHPRGRHRHHPRRQGRVPRPRGQLPRARAACRTCWRTATSCNRVFPEFFALLPGAPDQGLPDACCSTRCCCVAPRREPEPGGGGADARASTTRPTSSTRSSPARWACRWWRGATSSSRTTTSSCARTHGQAQVDVIYRRDRRRLPRSPRRSGATACSACPASSTSTARATWRSPTRPAPGVADDKAVYAFMPELIKYYLGEEPLLRPGADLPRLPQGRLRVHRASTSTSWW